MVIAAVLIASAFVASGDASSRRKTAGAGVLIAAWALAASFAGERFFLFSPILTTVPLAVLGYVALTAWERRQRQADLFTDE